MYRLLIVDDEPDVVEGLYNYFYNYEALEMDVFKAYSGIEALSMLYTERIDIVISDICMPGMTGLEMVKAVRKNWPYCQIIFLSGYTEFKYIYEAGQLGAVSYILKTEGYEKIAQCVQKAVQEIEDEVKLSTIKSNGSEFKHQFIFSLIQGEIISEEELKHVFDNFDIELDPYRPFFIMIGYTAGRMTIKDKSQIYAVINSMTRTHLLPYFNVLFDEYEQNIGIFVMQPHEIEDSGEDISIHVVYAKGAAEAIQVVLMDRLNIFMSFAVYAMPLTYQEAGRCYVKLKESLTERKDLCGGMILVVENTGPVINQKVNPQSFGETKAIAIIKDYIHKHLDAAISLTMLANMVYLNPSYLSRIFKQYTGITLIGYITNARIEKAKELLSSTNMKINSIASSLGFDSPSYFNQAFRRYARVSPLEYRARYGQRP